MVCYAAVCCAAVMALPNASATPAGEAIFNHFNWKEPFREKGPGEVRSQDSATGVHIPMNPLGTNVDLPTAKRKVVDFDRARRKSLRRARRNSSPVSRGHCSGWRVAVVARRSGGHLPSSEPPGRGSTRRLFQVLANLPLRAPVPGLKMARWSPCDAVLLWFFEAVS